MARVNLPRIFSFSMIVMVLFSLVGCSQWLIPGSSPVPTQPLPTQTSAVQAITPTPDQTLTPGSTPANAQKLILWLPAQFDPTNGTPGSNLLKERLRAFSDQHSGLQINVVLP